MVISLESNVIRIVHLDDETTEDSLKHFIQVLIAPTGLIENLSKLEVALIGPNLQYKKYGGGSSSETLNSESSTLGPRRLPDYIRK
ncbi:hypothetical protein JTB14_035757 [Gonioctena quinquepunctata]|nr:hypothetical protein JTB14_035757 [Gonioctena quinquepunctata]